MRLRGLVSGRMKNVEKVHLGQLQPAPLFSIIPVVGGVRSIVHVRGHGYSAPGELVTCLESIVNASCDEMIRISSCVDRAVCSVSSTMRVSEIDRDRER